MAFLQARMNKPPPDWLQCQREYWDTIAPSYDRFYQTEWSRLEDLDTVDMLRAAVARRGSRILELGCGTGYGFNLCRSFDAGIEYVGIDISENMLEQFRKQYSSHNYSLVCGSMSNLRDYALGQFDCIICIYTTLSFADNPVNTLRDCFHLLKPGCMLVVSIANRWSLRRILRCKFTRIESDFKTRGDRQSAVKTPAWTASLEEACSLMRCAGFTNLTASGQGLLAGVLEVHQLWKLDRRVARVVPQLCHTLNLRGQKP